MYFYAIEPKLGMVVNIYLGSELSLDCKFHHTVYQYATALYNRKHDFSLFVMIF